MEKIKYLGRVVNDTLQGFALSGLLATAGILYYNAEEIQRIYPYLVSDYNSEIRREASPGKPTTGLGGTIISGLEHLKMIRDLGLFILNENLDQNPEYVIYYFKDEKLVEIYTGDGELVKSFNGGSAQIEDLDEKNRFGQYVTPVGDYLVIDHFDKSYLDFKFGENSAFYGDGLVKLAGPWAPYIAFHGIPVGGENKLEQNLSHGCINLANPDIKWMIDHVGIGSEVHIRKSRTGLEDRM